MSFDSADLCRQKGWGPGTRLVGDEGYGPTWWKRLLDRGRGQLWPFRYSIDGSSWWSWRGRQFFYRPGRPS